MSAAKRTGRSRSDAPPSGVRETAPPAADSLAADQHLNPLEDLGHATTEELLGLALASADWDKPVVSGIHHAVDDLLALVEDEEHGLANAVFHIGCRLRVIAELVRRGTIELKVPATRPAGVAS